MNPVPTYQSQLIRLAQDIAAGQAQQNIIFYVCLAVLAIIIAAVSKMIYVLIEERTKIAVQSGNIESALESLRRTTRETEKIRTGIAHEDWTLKEVKTLRRKQLEELVSATLLTLHHLPTRINADEEHLEMLGEADLQVITIQKINTLYFPELNAATNRFINEYTSYHRWRVGHEAQIKILNKEIALYEKHIMADPEERKQAIQNLAEAREKYRAAVTTHSKEFGSQQHKLVLAKEKLLDDSKLLMSSLLATQPAHPSHD